MRMIGPQTPEINRTLGRIGFDRITLTHLIRYEDRRHNEKLFKEPIYKAFPNKDVLDANIAGHTLTRSVRKATIYGPGYEFSFGNHGGAPFTKISLHVTKEETADNLGNMSVDQVWEKLHDALDDIQNYYRLNMTKWFKPELVRVYRAEINITFPISRNFSDYQRILRLMTAVSEKSVSAEYRGQTSSLETFYIISGKTKSIDVYDKRAEMEKKPRLQMDCDSNLMRYEIKGYEQYLSQMSLDDEDRQKGHYQLHLTNIDDACVERLFLESTSTLFEKMDSHLRKQFPSSAAAGNLNSIYNASLIMALRSNAPEFVEKVLMQYASRERDSALVLLDIDDLISAINDSAIDTECKRLLCSSLDDINMHPERYSDGCSCFVGQREMYEELRQKLGANQDPKSANLVHYEMTVLKSDDNRQFLVWWQDPYHKKLVIPDHDETSVEWQLAKMRPSGWEDADIMETNNTPPLYYLHKDDYEYYRSKTGPVTRKVRTGESYMLITNDMWNEAKRLSEDGEKEWEDLVIAEHEARMEAAAIMGDVDPSFYGI